MYAHDRYDYTVVGAGMFGAVFARVMADRGARVLVLERDSKLGGNCADTHVDDGVFRHDHGPHIFHTDSEKVWNFMDQFMEFERYEHRAMCTCADGRVRSVPFSLHTFSSLYGCRSPQEMRDVLEQETAAYRELPDDFVGHALRTVGHKAFYEMVDSYSRKQWMTDDLRSLPSSIIKRIPLRFNWDDRYFADRYQGLPEHGYTAGFARMLVHPKIELQISTEWCGEWGGRFGKLVWSGQLDALFDHCYGRLPNRGLHFDHYEVKERDRWKETQGVAQMNFSTDAVPYTRKHEWNLLSARPREGGKLYQTVEVPTAWSPGQRPYYPIETPEAQKYRELAATKADLVVGGRLGTHRYLDMHQVVGMALKMADLEHF